MISRVMVRMLKNTAYENEMNQLSKIIFLLAFFFSLTIQAHWDYQLGFSGRSVPFGGTMTGTLGYNWLLWGESPLLKMPVSGPAEGPPFWKYGYIRPSALVQTIGLNNRTAVELDLFPISVLGMTFGQSVRYKVNQSFQYDCSQYACGGLLTRSYVRGQMVAGALGFFTVFTGRYESIYQPDSAIPFLEENDNLIGIPGSDKRVYLTSNVGYTINRHWQLGTTSMYSKLVGTRDNSLNHLFYVNHYIDRWTIFLGAGTFSSTRQELSPTIVVMVQFMGQRSFGLF